MATKSAHRPYRDRLQRQGDCVAVEDGGAGGGEAGVEARLGEPLEVELGGEDGADRSSTSISPRLGKFLSADSIAASATSPPSSERQP